MPTTRSRLIRLFLLVLLLAACAPQVVTSRRPGGSDQLTPEMMSRYSTVGAAIQSLRSGWLVRRSPAGLGPVQPSPVWVYRDGTRVGDFNVLTNLSTSEVAAIDYIDAVKATFRWGINHENGVIHITSR